MSAIGALFLIGMILLAAEVFVPGAILGIFAALALLGGVVLAFVDYGQMGGWIALAAALGLTGLTLYFEFVVLPRTKLGAKLFLNSAVAGTSQSPLAERNAVVGQPGQALTTLAPSGYVQVGGRRYEAFSQSGLIAPGEALDVVGLDNFRLIVRKSEAS